jgi:hypothetical protein
MITENTQDKFIVLKNKHFKSINGIELIQTTPVSLVPFLKIKTLKSNQ